MDSVLEHQCLMNSSSLLESSFVSTHDNYVPNPAGILSSNGIQDGTMAVEPTSFLLSIPGLVTEA
jgi:hypothetical protein